MFLLPQHFQQHEGYVEGLVNGCCLGLQAYDRGFYTLKINTNQLKIGKFARTDCRGIFPDGTPFNLLGTAKTMPPQSKSLRKSYSHQEN